jgi:hypothetical protein
MGTRREELSTADLAGQPPTSAQRSDDTDKEADLAPDDHTDAADLARDDHTEAADGTDDDVARTDDDVARDDLAPEDLAPEDPARDDLAGEPALTEGRSPDLATDAEPGEAPLQQDYGRHEATATGTDPDLASINAPAAQAAADVGTADTTTKAGHLLAADDAEAFRARWTDVQHGFVDAPRQAVEQADALVAELMQHLAKTFADERGRLEGQWDQGGDVSTEDQRTAFQRYRLFFERLLTT